MNTQITLEKLKFTINGNTHEDVSLSFGLEKTGLVGKNGIGKTSLVKMIMGQQRQAAGKITTNTPFAYLPQDYQFDLTQNVVEALGISEKLKAISDVKNSLVDEKSIETIASDWDIEDRAQSLLKDFGMPNLDLSKKMKDLSGGEKMKVVLAGIFLFSERFIILDEPTNNLDRPARELLYRYIAGWNGGMLVISHDRELLNVMDRIVEFSEKGLKIYGGNYDSYEGQKRVEQEAAHRLFKTAQQNYRKVKKQAQAVREKQEKRTSHAAKRAEKQSIPKVLLGAMQRAGQVTAGKLKTLHAQRIEHAAERLSEAKDKIPFQNQIHVDLSNTEVPRGKRMVEFKDVSFSYPGEDILLDKINFTIWGPEHVAIAGPNGSGKTTLIKLILDKLHPTEGNVIVGTTHIAYLDQQMELLNSNQTVAESVSRISGLNINESREWLSQFLFSQDEVFKQVRQLSGGERVRVGLAAILAGEKPAQLLVLDEPTNNLDLDSIEKVESALTGYKGVLVVISHDQRFLENIGVERYITLR